jgi:hypothetical protein
MRKLMWIVGVVAVLFGPAQLIRSARDNRPIDPSRTRAAHVDPGDRRVSQPIVSKEMP